MAEVTAMFAPCTEQVNAIFLTQVTAMNYPQPRVLLALLPLNLPTVLL